MPDTLTPRDEFGDMTLKLCAVILAGGRSRRMGVNKALLLIDGKPMIRKVLESVRLMTDQVLISSNDPVSYEFLGCPVVADVFRDQGPLAGLHAAMLQSPRPLFLLLACDLPNLQQLMLRRLVLRAEGFDAVIPRTPDGRDHPLCGVYRRTCLPVVESNLKAGANRVTDIFSASRLLVRRLSCEEGGFSAWDLLNLNSPEGLKAYQKHP